MEQVQEEGGNVLLGLHGTWPDKVIWWEVEDMGSDILWLWKT